MSDVTVRNLKPKEKPYKVSDGHGLYLLVNKVGKYWRMNYHFQGKQKTLALGVYPRVKLKDARKKCFEAKELLDEGIDPNQKKKEQKEQVDGSHLFKTITLEWYNKNKHTWVPTHAEVILRRFEKDIFPWLGDRPIRSITPPDLLTALRRVEKRGAIETAHRINQTCGQVFRYAIAIGKADYDISASLKGAIPPPKKRHMATITDPDQIGGLLRAIEGYAGDFTTRCALRIAAYTFVRPGELRHAEWSEILFESREWKIPAKKMKAKKEHIVPLASQVIEILLNLKQYTHHRSKYLFPSIRTNTRCMSENTVNGAIRRMGFTKKEMTSHGFRAMASTRLYEEGWPSDIIELQLAHTEKNKVKAAYNHAEHMKKRKEMMQWWADYLDRLETKK